MAAVERFDNFLITIVSETGGIEGLLNSMFSFLYRRTDFFYEMVPGDKMGFLPGEAEKMVRSGHYTASDHFQTISKGVLQAGASEGPKGSAADARRVQQEASEGNRGKSAAIDVPPHRLGEFKEGTEAHFGDQKRASPCSGRSHDPGKTEGGKATCA